jgi:hypothetical protein
MVHPEDQQAECLLRQIDPHARRETPPIRFYRKDATRPHVEAQGETCRPDGRRSEEVSKQFCQRAIGGVRPPGLESSAWSPELLWGGIRSASAGGTF